MGYSLPGHKDSDTTERLTFQILTVYQAQRRNGLLRTLLHFGQSEPLFSSFRTLISFQKTPCLPLGQMGEASSAQLRALSCPPQTVADGCLEPASPRPFSGHLPQPRDGL